MSEFTQNVKMTFAQRIRDGQCVVCGEKQPVEDLEVQMTENHTNILHYYLKLLQCSVIILYSSSIKQV